MMNKMMSVAAFAAALTLTASCALAATADAKIVAPNTEKITAPFAGTLLPFDYETGDSVSAHETLFTLDTTPVYATQAGHGLRRVCIRRRRRKRRGRALRRAGGHRAEERAVYRRFHRSGVQRCGQPLHPRGETLYLKLSNDKGTGVVTSVSGKKYTVEILSGSFDVDDTVRCFRESTTPSDSEVGRGKVTRYADVQVNANSGRIAAVHVKPGDAVEVGDLLLSWWTPRAKRTPPAALPPPRTA